MGKLYRVEGFEGPWQERDIEEAVEHHQKAISDPTVRKGEKGRSRDMLRRLAERTEVAEAT